MFQMSQVWSAAAAAYVHYLSFMVCVGCLVLERRLIQPGMGKGEATTMVVTDVIYGLAALLVLGSGILRVTVFGQGAEFYTENPVFWCKVAIFLTVGTLSLYPTVSYIRWAIPLREGKVPEVSAALAGRISWIINVELAGFALIPALAVLMARGIGLPAGA